MTKKTLTLVLTAFLALGLFSACGGSSDSVAKSSTSKTTSSIETKTNGPKYRIGVASNNFNDKWQTYMLDGITAQSKEYPEFEFVFSDGNEDANKQIGQVEDFITSGVDGIVLIAVNTDTAGPITSACKEADIPLITVNRLLSNQDEATAYVGSESIEAGIMAGQIAFENNPSAKTAILMGTPGNEAAVKRTEGYRQVAEEKYPDVEFVAEEIGNWNRDEAMTIVENWLQAGIHFDTILANNDEMAIGAVLALEAAGTRDKVFVVGVDATPDALDFMKQGRLDGSVYQSADGQGRGAVDTIVKAVQGELDENIIWIPFEPVTIDKVDEYIEKWK